MNIEAVIREYIEKSPHLSLATVRGAKPWVCEVHFVYDKDLQLYFRSLPSSRHSRELADNPFVAGDIVKQHALEDEAHGIYFEGWAQQMTDEAERQSIFPYFQARLGMDEDILAEAKTPEGRQFYKITVSTWYAFGKFDGAPAQKYSLPWAGTTETEG